jgi:hypothetical protein
MRPPLPRAPRRHRLDEIACHCEPDEPCTCVEKDEMAYGAECESRYDRWKDGDDEDRLDRDWPDD